VSDARYSAYDLLCNGGTFRYTDCVTSYPTRQVRDGDQNWQMTATVLIIDDTPAEVRLLVDLLRGHGFRLLVALDGLEGVRKAQAGRPDVVLLDVRMPDPDGIAVCRLLKSDPRCRDIPVILLTGLDAPEDKLEGFRAGASDYVTKPFFGDEVLARLRVHLEIRHRLRALAAADSPDAAVVVAQPTGLVDKVKVILLEEMAEPPTLAALAARLGTNERRLSEDFRRHTGLPVFGYLREERHRRACELLLATDTAIGLIAEQVGYTSAAAFTNAFRDRFGVSPREFRCSAGLAVPEEPGGV